jgi:predicted MFS family arabinose efflux permease
VLSIFGDWFLLIALPFQIYRLTGSAFATSLVFVAEAVPTLLLGAVAGVFADRYDRRTTMIACDAFRAVAILFLLFVVSRNTLWTAYAVTMAASAAGLLFLPSKQALIPRLVAPAQLVSANALDGAASAGAMLAGPLVGGLMYAALGFTAVVVADSATFVLSAVALALMSFRDVSRRLKPIGGASTDAVDHAPARTRRAWLAGAVGRLGQELGEGVTVVRSSRLLPVLLITQIAMGTVNGALGGLIVPFVAGVLHGGSAQLGAIGAAQGAGGLAGAVVAGRLAKWIGPRHLVPMGLMAGGVVLFGLVASRTVPLAVVSMAMAAAPVVLATIAMQTLIQTNSDDRYLARIFAVFGTVAALFQMIGAGAAGGLADVVGTVTMMGAVAALLALTGLATQIVMLRARTQVPA